MEPDTEKGCNEHGLQHRWTGAAQGRNRTPSLDPLPLSSWLCPGAAEDQSWSPNSRHSANVCRDGDFGAFISLEWKWGSRPLTSDLDSEPAPQHLRFVPVPSGGLTRVTQHKRWKSHHPHNKAERTWDDAWVGSSDQISPPPPRPPQKLLP